LTAVRLARNVRSSPFKRIAMPLPTPLSQHIIRRPQRIALLAHIAEQGSITRAAKSAGLSYKAAWDAIDELNNLAQQPLVERSVGGKGGGGARLTHEGERVLRLYQRLQLLQAEVLASDEAASDFNLLGRLMLRTSARNQLHGRVHAIESQAGTGTGRGNRGADQGRVAGAAGPRANRNTWKQLPGRRNRDNSPRRRWPRRSAHHLAKWPGPLRFGPGQCI